jgi:hypothetical protein
MAKSPNLMTVADGVKPETHRKFRVNLTYDESQGYFSAGHYLHPDSSLLCSQGGPEPHLHSGQEH